MSGAPFRCPKCRKATGFKYVSKLTRGGPGPWRAGAFEEDVEDLNLRGSCRFCGHVREEARDTPSVRDVAT